MRNNQGPPSSTSGGALVGRRRAVDPPALSGEQVQVHISPSHCCQNPRKGRRMSRQTMLALFFSLLSAAVVIFQFNQLQVLDSHIVDSESFVHQRVVLGGALILQPTTFRQTREVHKSKQTQATEAPVPVKDSGKRVKATKAPVLVKDSRDSESVCFMGFVPIRIMPNATKTFVTSMLEFAREISLRSFGDALTNGGGQVIHLRISFGGDLDAHFASWDEFCKYFMVLEDKYHNLKIYMEDSRKKNPEGLKTWSRVPETLKCAWIFSTKLDADDVMMPGYLDWMRDEVVPKLRREEKLGALVTTRENLPKILVAFDRCTALKPSKGQFWSGFSVGQTTIMRKDLFEKIRFVQGGHYFILNKFRKIVMTKFLNQKVPSGFFPEDANFTQMEAADERIEEQSRIKLVDTYSSGFGTAGFYMHTLLSGHFRYTSLPRAAVCTEREWAKVMKKSAFINQDITSQQLLYIRDGAQQIIKVTPNDLCESHQFFKERKLTGNKTCAEDEMRILSENGFV